MCPAVDTLYIADWGFCPYGEKSETLVLERAHFLTKKLIDHGCTHVVVACNTATSVALESLRDTYDIAFTGVQPPVELAAAKSKSGVIGVVATPITLRGRLFQEAVARLDGKIDVHTAAGEGLVELVESGDFSSEKARLHIAKVINPIIAGGADHIVLGCTHYSFFAEMIQEMAGPAITVVDSASHVALQIAKAVCPG